MKENKIEIVEVEEAFFVRRTEYGLFGRKQEFFLKHFRLEDTDWCKRGYSIYNDISIRKYCKFFSAEIAEEHYKGYIKHTGFDLDNVEIIKVLS
jgi:hypothetical protein